MSMKEKYQSLALADLKEIAKSRGIRGTSSMKKADVIEAMLALDEKESQGAEAASAGQKPDAAEQRSAAAERKAVSAEQKPAAAERKSAVHKKTTEQRTGAPQNAESEKADAAQNQSRPQENRAAEGQSRPQENGTERRPVSRIVRSAGADGQMRGAERRSVRRFAPAPGTAGQAQNHAQGNGQAQGAAHQAGNGYASGSGTAAGGTQNPGSAAEKTDAPAAQTPVLEEGFPAELDSGISANGILEVMPDGYGFIRCANYLPGENDVYVAPSQIRRFGLKTGDIIVGNTRVKTQNEKFSALLYVKSINGYTPDAAVKRYNFEDMTPIFPDERIGLELSRSSVAMRIMDLISPVGKGQRGLIVSPPKAGKTTLLKQVAQSVKTNNPDMHLIILLIDERPEEVTDFREAIEGPNVEVIYSTFDELPEHHKRVAEMVIERAKRLVEHKKDVMILLDSITRLTRAYNLVVPPSGRTLSGGLDPAALHMPKRFFGAARNMREGGSLTILATALVDTGSRMDDVIYEEFKGTGNMEIVLDRKLSERRVFPAIDIPKSSTRREDLLLSPEELEATGILRKALNGLKPEEAVDKILDMFTRTRSNTDFVNVIRKMKIL